MEITIDNINPFNLPRSPQELIDKLAKRYNDLEYHQLTNDNIILLRHLKSEMYRLLNEYPDLDKPFLKEYL